MIRALMPQLVRKRAHELLTIAHIMYNPDLQTTNAGAALLRKGRSAFMPKLTGFSEKYMRELYNEKMEYPSSGVFLNLGIELWARDPRTGEMEQIRLEGPCETSQEFRDLKVSSTLSLDVTQDPYSSTSELNRRLREVSLISTSASEEETGSGQKKEQ